MNCDYDIAFAGAGLAAMSLAVRLAALPNPPGILLIDPRTEPLRDRTWCHWQLHDDPFRSAITHRWHHWTIRHHDQSTTAHSAEAPYIRIPADRLHQIAQEKLSAHPQVTTLRGVSVSAIENHSHHTKLQLSDGKKLTAGWTFDSRPPPNPQAPWHQIFRGLELHSPDADLDPRTVTLMDFQSAGPEGIRFFYCLPLDRHTVLVEDTWLVPSGKNPTLTDEKILHYTAKNFPSAQWQIRHREEGNLPMGLTPAKSKTPTRIIPWGTAAGAVRASSGYAFSRIQRASEAMSLHWSRHHRPHPGLTHDSTLLAWMDRVFLRVMDRHPEQVPDFFLRLFTRVPSDALIRFLESEPRPSDIFKIMRALPTAPFLAAALR